MKRKLKTMSTKRTITITSPLKSLNTKKTTTYADRKSGPVFANTILNRLIKPKPAIGLAWFGLVGFMVFNAAAHNISVISWWSVLSVEKTTDLSQVTDKLYHILLYRLSGNQTHNASGDSKD
jgi:hypothetical protein